MSSSSTKTLAILARMSHYLVTTVEMSTKAVQAEIDKKRRFVDDASYRFEMVQEANRDEVLMATKDLLILVKFLADVSRDWLERECRVLDHVLLSPALNAGVGAEGFTEDWAVIEIDRSKIDSANILGNRIDVGTVKQIVNFKQLMFPDRYDRAKLSVFGCPCNCLLKISGAISESGASTPYVLSPGHASRASRIELQRS